MTTEFQFKTTLERSNGDRIVDEEITVTVAVTIHGPAKAHSLPIMPLRTLLTSADLRVAIIEHVGLSLSQSEIATLQNFAAIKWRDAAEAMVEALR